LNQRRRKSALFKLRVDLESVMSNGMADSKKRDALRLRKAERRQLEMRAYDLDSLLPEDHRARVVWAAVERLDLSAYHEAIDAREGTAGQPATDPAILLVRGLTKVRALAMRARSSASDLPLDLQPRNQRNQRTSRAPTRSPLTLPFAPSPSR
jgi:hypothetical protein